MALRTRARLVGRAVALGLVFGVLTVPIVIASGESLRYASQKVFAVGALVFGFALLGWSGSVFAGEAVENVQTYMDTNSEWSEADSRRAMTFLGGIGAGGMVGASLATVVLGIVA